MSSQDDNPDEEATLPRHSSTNKSNALYEPKSTPKVIRVLTVIAYILSVSLAAITLSAYYVFVWDGGPHTGAQTAPEDEGIGDNSVQQHVRNFTSPEFLEGNRTIAEELKGNWSEDVSTSVAQQEERVQMEALARDLNYNKFETNRIDSSPEVFSTSIDEEISFPIETTTMSEFSPEFVETVKRNKFLQKLMFKENVDEFLQEQLQL